MKKISVVLLTSLMSGVSACSPASQPVSVPQAQTAAQSGSTSVYDLKGTLNGKPTGVNLSIALNTPVNGFSTKASTDGQKRGLASDIRSYKVYLTGSSAAPETGTRAGGSGTFFTVDRDGSVLSAPHTVTFNNVPVGTWYAAVSAWDGTGASGNNITKEMTFSDGNHKLGVSTNFVTVNSDLTLSFSSTGTTLDVSLQLQDEIGAIVETSITPVDGAAAGSYGAN